MLNVLKYITGDKMNITLNKSDEIVMKLLHYFITIQGYNPVVLHGAKDEIWLENSDADYKIIRIVTNYIHNDEQLDFDMFKTKQITKKIKKKMFSLKLETLSIFINLGENVHLDKKQTPNIECVDIKNLNDLTNYSFIMEKFPNILEIENTNKDGVDLFIKLTEDINKKNLEESRRAEQVFSKKRPVITYAIIALNIILFILTALFSGSPLNIKISALYKLGALVNYNQMYGIFELYRLITSMFLHGSILHLLCNMYSLYVLGPQLESFFGKIKFLVIYLMSGIIGNLLSMLFLPDTIVSIGASGAIFGLLGSMLYFGYHYRVYLSGVIKSQIIPLILLNLIIGFSSSGINNAAHIGGLIGGVLITMAVGIKYKSHKYEIINGIAMTFIFVAFLSYMIFFN